MRTRTTMTMRNNAWVKWVVGATILMAVTLIGWTIYKAVNVPSSGWVISKKYHPGYTYTTTQCTGYSRSGMCTTWIMVPAYMPPDWVICLRGDPQGESGKVKTGCRDVDQLEYNSYLVGDHYPHTRSAR